MRISAEADDAVRPAEPDLWLHAAVRFLDLMLDPFWVGRRGDAFDETCR